MAAPHSSIALLILFGSRWSPCVRLFLQSIIVTVCIRYGLTREQLARGSGSIVDTSNSRSLDMRVSKLRRMLNSLSPNPGDWLESVRGRGYRLTAKVEKLTNV
jgi:hypothetical protein